MSTLRLRACVLVLSSAMRPLRPSIGPITRANNGPSKSTSSGQSGLGSLVGKFLDADGDGNVVDDLLSLGKKFL